MTEANDLGAAIGRVVARFARVTPPYSAQAHLYRDLGIESVQVLHLLFALEAEFAVSLDDRRFIQSATLDDLTRLVDSARSPLRGLPAVGEAR